MRITKKFTGAARIGKKIYRWGPTIQNKPPVLLLAAKLAHSLIPDPSIATDGASLYAFGRRCDAAPDVSSKMYHAEKELELLKARCVCVCAFVRACGCVCVYVCTFVSL